MKRYNVQLNDGANDLYVKTHTSNVKFGEVTTSRKVGNILEGTDLSGLALTDYINGAYGVRNRMVFLHISDTHGKLTALNEMITLANTYSDVDFVVHTGDIAKITFNRYVESACQRPKLLVWGNHDTYDTYSDSTAAAAAIRDLMSESDVNYGSETASYWYKDIATKKGDTVRIIGFDEYEMSDTVHLYSVAYTQAQMDWFINLLRNTPSSYYLLLVHHQSVEMYSTDKYSDFKSIQVSKKTKLKVGDGEDSEIIPKILDAYLNRRTFTYSSTYVSIDEDFSNVQPATFIMHIGGHIHADVCERLANFPSQLQLLVCRSDKDVSPGPDDLTFGDETYCINMVTVDFYMKQVRVQRIGAKEKSDGTYRIMIDYYNR